MNALDVITRRRTLLAILAPLSLPAAADTSNGPNPYAAGYGFDQPHEAPWGGWRRGDAGTLYAEWDVFNDNSQGGAGDRTAAPDLGSAGTSSARLGWNVGTFVSGTGNLYSFTVPQQFSVHLAGATAAAPLRVALQVETQGLPLKSDSFTLNGAKPTETREAFRNPAFPSPQGPTDLIQTLLLWDLRSLPNEFVFVFGSAEPHVSLAQVAVDIGPLPKTNAKPTQGGCTNSNDAPVLDAIAPRWDVKVGQEMQFRVSGLDPCDDDVIDIRAIGLPAGARMVNQGYDSHHKRTAVFKFKPVRSQMNKLFGVNLRAVETQKNGKASKTWKTFIRVWPTNVDPKPTPTPALGHCTPQNDPPTLDLLTSPWNAEVGREMRFTVTGLDVCENDAVRIKPSALPVGAKLINQSFAEGKRVALLKFKPQGSQANKLLGISFQAVETRKGGKASNSSKTFIRVWPANNTPTGKLIREIPVYRARWASATSQLVVSGRVVFTKPLSAQEWAGLSSNKLRVSSGSRLLGETVVKPSGDWSVTLDGLSDVPCSIVVNFGGTKAWRDVRGIPPQGCSPS